MLRYDSEGRVSSSDYTIDYLVGSSIKSANITNNYSYTNDGRLTSSYVKLGNKLTSTYTYDILNRVTEIVYQSGTSNGYKNQVEYTYLDSNYDGESTSGLVSQYNSYVFTGGTTVSAMPYYYEYDERGNITHVQQGAYHIYYHYDDLGQLLREDNESLHKTTVYTYDNAGNITSMKIYSYTTADTITSTPTFNYSYEYNDSWGDQLTSYRGISIEYDEIGNIERYYNGARFTWEGRQLKAATKAATSYTFVYNSDGLRTEKTVNDVVHKYYYTGTQLLAEEWGEHLYIFLYDASGAPIGMKYRTTSYASGTYDTYWYERNLQGDVVAIYGDNGTKYANYYYNAWGSHTTEYYNGGHTVTAIKRNPIRYRGYYYDIDLDLYYLQSRYYDSSVSRFISPDAPENLGVDQTLISYNLYAYCSNNPVMHTDPTGCFIGSIVIASTIVGGLLGAFSAAATGGNIVEGAVEGVLTGAISSILGTTTPLSTFATVATATFTGFVIDLTIQGIFNSQDGRANIDYGRAVKTGLQTGISAWVPCLGKPIDVFGTALAWAEVSALIIVADVITTNMNN